ncbi:MAG: peptidoglycan recognition protein family protein [Candidatus Gastranaerophilales bacterium]|nr:peptidoglycan recognition protein family protein [Candidatus Gastranaerophilales bacterium]
MKRIIIHWTAGTGSPNSVDKQHYHYLIDSKGEMHNGDFKPEDNENCTDGKYAAHTGGGNTGSIGVSMCGMYGFTSADNIGKYPLTAKQCERCFKLIAELAKEYNISITPETVMTHYEFGLKNPSTTSAGKIDIVYLPPFPDVAASQMGDFIRSKALWYYKKI